MRKIVFESVAILMVSFCSACAVGCGGSEEAEIVGVPSAEIQAEFEKSRAGYAESMKKSGS